MIRGSTKYQVLIISTMILVVSAGLGCIMGEVTEERTFTDFTAVDVGSGFHVTITQGSKYTITITTSADVMQNVTVSKVEAKLFIGLKPGDYEDMDMVLRAKITMPELNEVVLSGGSHCTAREFDSTQSTLSLSGGSHLTLKGSTDTLTASGSGGSHLKLANFRVEDANVTLSGGSQATISMEGTLNADLSGGSHLYYKGTPTMGSIQTTGGSQIAKG